LNEMYPQYVNVDVATTRSPEETHRLFVDKLKEGDLDGAVECCVVKDSWNNTKEGLERVKDSGKLAEMISDLDTDLEPNVIGDTISSFNYYAEVDGKMLGSILEFRKDKNGVWLIESL